THRPHERRVRKPPPRPGPHRASSRDGSADPALAPPFHRERQTSHRNNRQPISRAANRLFLLEPPASLRRSCRNYFYKFRRWRDPPSVASGAFFASPIYRPKKQCSTLSPPTAYEER